jgi:hypothetical protein
MYQVLGGTAANVCRLGNPTVSESESHSLKRRIENDAKRRLLCDGGKETRDRFMRRRPRLGARRKASGKDWVKRRHGTTRNGGFPFRAFPVIGKVAKTKFLSKSDRKSRSVRESDDAAFFFQIRFQVSRRMTRVCAATPRRRGYAAKCRIVATQRSARLRRELEVMFSRELCEYAAKGAATPRSCVWAA